MRAYVGTSGYSYKEWKGDFYPAGLKNDEMLGYYAGHFPTVEINATFYRMPRESMLVAWRERTPDAFSFALKASRRITHLGRINANVEDAVDYLFDQASALGDKLGPVLFQLPPFQRVDVERLRGFLGMLPAGRRAALEFRHPSWFDESVFAALREHDAALCVTDGQLDDEVPLVPTAGWGYLRLRAESYDAGELAGWAGRIRAQGWSDAWVFFKHEREATTLASRLIAALDAGGGDGT